MLRSPRYSRRPVPRQSGGTFSRGEALRRLSEEHFDVVIIGGGITGAGCLLDAASRGLSAALIEKDDFASGTSSKSSKLVHGGLRYLQQRRVVLVYEALAERQRLLHNAPHLVRILPFLIPVFSTDGLINPKAARALGTAMWAYDLTGGLRIGKKHQRLSAGAALELFPTLSPDRLDHGYIYYDCETDDARLTLAVVRTAVLDFGAVAANRATATGILKSASGKCQGVVVETIEGDSFDISCDTVISAAGVWSDEVRSLDEQDAAARLRPAKGIHVGVPREIFANEVAAVVPVSGDKRSVFIIPWEKITYLGTTDTDYEGDIDNPSSTLDDVEYLLKAANDNTSANVGLDDIVSVWSGLRPLVKDSKSQSTADMSRRHSITTSPSGVVSVVGGKLTTYRKMASDAVDEVLQHLDRDDAGLSRTLNLKLRGAPEEVPEKVSEKTTEKTTVGRYGTEEAQVQALVETDPALSQPMHEDLPYIMAEATYAARFEMAVTLDDVLSRRTRARLQNARASADAAPAVAELLAGDLGWSQERTKDEIERYRRSVETEMCDWR